MKNISSNTPTADEIAEMADKGEDISRFFTNTGTMKYPQKEIEATLIDALRNEVSLAKYRQEQFRKMCFQFENKYGFNSDVFMKKFEDGQLGDDTDFFDWFAYKRGFDHWKKKYQILKEISL